MEERPSIATSASPATNSSRPRICSKSLTKAGLAEGQIFNKVVLDGLEQDLLDQYCSHGHYGVNMKTDVRDGGRNRVEVKVTISEGVAARIRAINIVGNHDFDKAELARHLQAQGLGLLDLVRQFRRVRP